MWQHPVWFSVASLFAVTESTVCQWQQGEQTSGKRVTAGHRERGREKEGERGGEREREGEGERGERGRERGGDREREKGGGGGE